MTAENSGSGERSVVVTRRGDRGETQVGNRRVSKSAPRVEAYGTVDEANSTIGLLRTAVTKDARLAEWLRAIQVDLFDIGADLNMPDETGAALRFKAEPTLRIEAQLDELNAQQPPLKNFILPTGSEPAVAYAHLARAVVWRAERRVVALTREEREEVNPEILRYLNRLADFLFVVARHLNDDGRKDDLWSPGVRRLT